LEVDVQQGNFKILQLLPQVLILFLVEKWNPPTRSETPEIGQKNRRNFRVNKCLIVGYPTLLQHHRALSFSRSLLLAIFSHPTSNVFSSGDKATPLASGSGSLRIYTNQSSAVPTFVARRKNAALELLMSGSRAL
jgi:hypothetical protein